VSDGAGKLYVNLEDSAQVVEVDARAMRVLRRWSIAPCGSPTGLAIDRAHHRLFSGCRSGVMAVSDAAAGRLVTTVPIGQAVDACRFDPGAQLAFASNGDGTLTVIHEDAPDRYTCRQRGHEAGRADDGDRPPDAPRLDGHRGLRAGPGAHGRAAAAPRPGAPRDFRAARAGAVGKLFTGRRPA